MEFTWILPLVAGYVLGIVWSNLVTIGRTGMFVQKVCDQTLKLIINVAEDVEFIRAMKYDAIDQTGDSATTIRERNMDEYNFKRWKSSVIQGYLDNYPTLYRRQFVKFSDWDGAIQHLNQQHRKSR